jgi:hypothetical protein
LHKERPNLTTTSPSITRRLRDSVETHHHHKKSFHVANTFTISLLERRGLQRPNTGLSASESTNESAQHRALPPRALIAPLKIKMGDIMEPGIWEEKEELRTRGPIYNTRIWLTDILRPMILTRGGAKMRNSRTAYLDGLRGFAAFLVYWHHHQLWPRQNYMIMGADYIFENSWGSLFPLLLLLCLCRGPFLFRENATCQFFFCIRSYS